MSNGIKTIILGLGNTILTDDGVGIYVARRIKETISPSPSTPPSPSPYKGEGGRTTIKEASVGGFNFIDILSGYDRAVIIDAIHTKSGHPGEFYEVDINCLKPSARISSLHGIDLATACDMARKMGIDFPKEIRIFVMEVEDEFSFGEKCTPAVEAAITKMAGEVFECLSV